MFLMPGLVDSHVHLWDEADLRLYLAAGVTTVVNMSGAPIHLEWQRELRDGDLLGPTLYTTGPMIDTATDPLFGIIEEVGSEADAERVVVEHARCGYDFVKLHGDLEVGLYDAIAAAAERERMPV